jgi:hypothetical protein
MKFDLRLLTLAVFCFLCVTILGVYRRRCYLLQSTVSYALGLLDRYFLLFTSFDPFLQYADRNAYRSTNTDGWQLSGCNQLIDFCAS